MRSFDGYTHGINLGGWLSQCDHDPEHYATFITEDDFRNIRNYGLDHVRIPVDYEVISDGSGNLKEEGFKIIDRAYVWCRKYDLNMIFDLHKTYGFSFDFGENETGFFDSEEYQEMFYKLWEAISSRYGRCHEHMAFELLNEVTDKEYCDTWNSIIRKCISRIRVNAPETYIITGGYYNNSIDAIPDLEKPADDRVVFTFHCYEPLIFTHQGAYWAPGMDTSFRIPLDATYGQMAKASKEYLSQVTVGFDGFDEDGRLSVEYFDKYFSEAVSVAERLNVPLYCGEYGVINLADPEETLRWYGIISEAFDKYRIGRSAWNYKEKDFGLMDDHMSAVREEVMKKL